MEVVFGESFGREQPAARYAALHYKFKPASACQGRAGTLSIDGDAVTLRRSGGGGGEGGSLFEGQWAPAAPEAECLAIYDEASGRWRLEALCGTAANLRCTQAPGAQQQQQPGGSPAPRSPAPVPQRSEEDGGARALSHEPAELHSQQRRLPSSIPSSVTPSVAGPPSRDTSVTDDSLGAAAVALQPREAQEAAAPVSTELLRGPSPAASPSVTRPPASSSLPPQRRSSSGGSSGSGSGEEREVTKPPPVRLAAAPSADVPDFERDFFADQEESEEDADSSSASESSGHDSEEEAKHF